MSIFRGIPVLSALSVLVFGVTLVSRTFFGNNNNNVPSSKTITTLGQRLNVIEENKSRTSSPTTKSLMKKNNKKEESEKKLLYNGEEWNNPDERTISRTIVADTKFARCEIHSVRSEDGSNVIDDWLWFDEKNAINVLVQTEENHKFIILKQKKYGLIGETYSPVGGMIEGSDKSPFHAARREVMEELGLASKNTIDNLLLEPSALSSLSSSSSTLSEVDNDQERSNLHYHHNRRTRQMMHSNKDNDDDDGKVPQDEKKDWKFLGKYRTAANRGGGYTYCYFLQNARSISGNDDNDDDENENNNKKKWQSVGDDETQIIMELSIDEMWNAIQEFKFQEIKWVATVTLALISLEKELFFLD